jgi:membrane-bound lytic murein transglycosylase F
MKFFNNHWLPVFLSFISIPILSAILLMCTSMRPYTSAAVDTSEDDSLNIKASSPDSVEVAVQKDFIQQSSSTDTLVQKPPKPISPYDDLFRQEAEAIGWDWYILAAIGYHESKFHAHVVGPGGASGVMGIMPATGRRFGYSRKQLLVPANNIRAGAKTLQLFENKYKQISDKEQRIKFALVAYASGERHLSDAQRLAAKYGKDDKIWDNNVEDYAALLSQPKYYKDPVVKYGRFRGAVVIRFIEDIENLADKFRKQHGIAPK